MLNYLNGNATNKRLAEVITYRNMAASLRSVYQHRTLAEDGSLNVSLVIWFQELFSSEVEAFWISAYDHLDEVVQAETLRLWMDYPEHWELPVGLRGGGIDPEKIRTCGGWVFYPTTAMTSKDIQSIVVLEDKTQIEEFAMGRNNGSYAKGSITAGNGKEQITLDDWHRIYKRPTPSHTARERCLRLCILSRLTGRRLASSKELLIAEARAFLGWALVKQGGTALAEASAETMRALLLDDTFVQLVHQLPERS